MRFLVTGGTGFIGGHLIERLVEQGHHVTALVRTPSKAKRLEELGVTLLRGDLSLFAKEDCILDEADIVVHLAGVVAAQNPEEYEAINYTAVIDLMHCLERQEWRPKRLLFSSSLAAAGPSPSGPWKETDTLAPIDPYGDAKARAEGVLKDASFPVTMFRPPIVLGAGDPAFLTLFKAAQSGVGFRVTGPAQRLSWIYVEDLVDAIYSMAEDTRTENFIYYTTSEQIIDTDELWGALQKALSRHVTVLPIPGPILSIAASVAVLGSKLFGFRNQLDHKQVAQMRSPAFTCTSAALSNDLDWSAQHTFEDAVQKTADGYKQLGWL